MTNAKRLFLVWLVLLSLSVSVSCVPQSPTKDEVNGLWVERRDTSRLKDAGPCAYFEFSDGGQFKAYNIPREYFILDQSLPLKYLTRVSATGSWALDTSSRDPFALHRINLDFDPIPGFPTGFSSHLLITYQPERVLLAGVADNPWVIFYKKTEPKCE